MPNSNALVPEASPRNGRMDKLVMLLESRRPGGGAGQQDSKPVIQQQGGPGHQALPLTETKSLPKFLELNPNV